MKRIIKILEQHKSDVYKMYMRALKYQCDDANDLYREYLDTDLSIKVLSHLNKNLKVNRKLFSNIKL